MTVFPIAGAAGYSVDHGTRVVAHARLNEVIALRKCAMYRKSFQGITVGYPAAAMRLDAIAGWMRRHGVTVDVSSVDDLDWTAIAGIGPSHIVMHGCGQVCGPIALGYGVSQVIVDSHDELSTLLASATRPCRVLVDVTEERLDDGVVADRG